jgi:hypothetical protein
VALPYDLLKVINLRLKGLPRRGGRPIIVEAADLSYPASILKQRRNQRTAGSTRSLRVTLMPIRLLWMKV